MRIIAHISQQIILSATSCPHCGGSGKVWNPPVGPITCGGCSGSGSK